MFSAAAREMVYWSTPMTILRALLAALIVLPVTAAQAQTLAIRAGTLIDPETGTVSRNQIILVENGKITALGGNVTVPPNATSVDLSNATVLPGLFDMHTHLCLTMKPRRDADNYFYTVLDDPDSARAIEGVVNARTMLESGFTTIRDVGNEGNFACTSVRRAIEKHLVPGPTMFNAGRIIAPYGGQFSLQPDKPTVGEPEYFFADTRDEMLKGIREDEERRRHQTIAAGRDRLLSCAGWPQAATIGAAALMAQVPRPVSGPQDPHYPRPIAQRSNRYARDREPTSEAA